MDTFSKSLQSANTSLSRLIIDGKSSFLSEIHPLNASSAIVSIWGDNIETIPIHPLKALLPTILTLLKSTEVIFVLLSASPAPHPPSGSAGV